MNAEIIAVGSEMLTPERVDTNSLYLTRELNKLGVEVVSKTIVGDDRDRLADAVAHALRRSPVVILTGGLGPTEDDVTREAVARALDRKLVFDAEIGAALVRRFAQLKRKMAENNRRQAFVIEGAGVLPNDRGTAPGQWLEESGGVVMLLPGPPYELRAMFERQCLPRLARIVPPLAIRTCEMRATGITESELDQLIAPVYKKYDNPVTTILASDGTIQIHLRARCSTVAEADRLLAEVAGPIQLLLGDRMYSANGDPLEVVVGGLLVKSHATLAVAESCTGGMLGERITSAAGSSRYFLGGLVTYRNEMKVELLGVSPETLERFGPVSAESAAAMAIGASRRTGATYGLAITGVAGPDPVAAPDGQLLPAGAVYIGIAGPEGVRTAHRQYPGDRKRVRVFSTQLALDLLRRQLLGKL
ncbi:MAG: competence/damage-inducible protein A [Bryobacteraceae bacterium]